MRPEKSRVARAAAALLALVVSVTTSLGQAPTSTCTDYPSVEVVFIGTLTAFTPSPISSPMKFEALESLMGESINSITVLRVPGSHCRNPDPPVIGERYLVVAQGPSMNHSYSCADLKREGDAAADIEYFRLARWGVTPTEVSGEVRIIGKGTPVQGAKIELTGTAGLTKLISDAKGRFHAVLKPGTYEVITEFPSGYESGKCGGESVTVAEHRCVRLVICAQPKPVHASSVVGK